MPLLLPPLLGVGSGWTAALCPAIGTQIVLLPLFPLLPGSGSGQAAAPHPAVGAEISGGTCPPIPLPRVALAEVPSI